jgi:hypothetical protein
MAITGTSRSRSTAAVGPRRLPRTTGAVSALWIIALGAWGALIPFIGPYFHYSFGSNQTWHYTTNRLWLDILPGAVAVIAGLMLLRSAHRTSGLFAGWLAIAAGAWFALGLPVSLLWHHAGNPIGAPVGGNVRHMAEYVGYFYGLGILIAALAAFATGRFLSRPHLATEVAGAGVVAADAAAAERTRRRERVADDAVAAHGERPRRFGFLGRRRSTERTQAGPPPA